VLFVNFIFNIQGDGYFCDDADNSRQKISFFPIKKYVVFVTSPYVTYIGCAQLDKQTKNFHLIATFFNRLCSNIISDFYECTVKVMSLTGK
jgi:hypothetical protein